MSNQLSFFSHFFSEIETLTPRFAILNRDLQLLHVQSRRPEDLASLPLAATQAMHFFNLREGDLILLNDPSCGGLGSGDLTWVTVCQGLVFAYRQTHVTPWTVSLKREDEGLRIPPTPLRMNGEVNSGILDILCEQLHSSCRINDFNNIISRSMELSRIISDRLNQTLKIRPGILDKDKQKDYFTNSKKYFLKKFIDRIHGETRVELPLRTGEVLKLKLSCEEAGIKIDLGGSSQGQKLFIPESWSQGAVIAFVMDQMNERLLFNQGSFSTINLIKPQQSFLSAKSQNALGPAQRLGLASLWTALHLAFHELLPKSLPALHDYFPLQLQWQHQGRLHEFTLPSGTGAFRDKESYSGYLLNKETTLGLGTFNESPCFEILDLHERKLAAQRNSLNGGPGWSLKLKVQTEMPLQWYGNNIKWPYRFPKSLTAIEPAEILINNEVRSDAFGRVNLKPGDEIILNSGQGAGFSS